MKRVMQRWIVCWALGLAGACVHAANPTADEMQRRERLAVERTAARAHYDAAVRECQNAFAVTGCMNQAKSQRRAALDRVAREEAVLDDAQRRRRAEERRQRIAQKQQAVATRGAASAPDVQLRAPRQPQLSSGARRPSRRPEPRSPELEAAEAATARERQTQAQQRRERAAAHEQAVRQRNEERAARKPPAAPLPVPGAAASAAPHAGSGSAPRAAAPASR